MPGGEKIGKKIKRKKPVSLKRESDASGKVSLKVKIHQPEIKKKNGNKSETAGQKQKVNFVNKKIISKKESDQEKNMPPAPISRFKSGSDAGNIKTELKKNPVSRPEDEDKVYRQKQTVMWSGIAFFMILIIFVWTYNIKKTFQAVENKSDDQSMNVDMDKIGDELSAKMKEMKENLAEIKAYSDQMSNPTASSTFATASITDQNALSPQPNQLPADNNTAATTSSTTVSDVSRQELDELKAKLKNLEDKINEKN